LQERAAAAQEFEQQQRESAKFLKQVQRVHPAGLGLPNEACCTTTNNRLLSCKPSCREYGIRACQKSTVFKECLAPDTTSYVAN
jgi:hypothetical protein